MSIYVKKVHFKLHESYANPNRIVVKPPYEITETGWGEFEVVIKIYFNDQSERPVTCYHILKLFQSPVVDGELTSSTTMDTKKGLVSESYEEIVFQEPTQIMQHYLLLSDQSSIGLLNHDTDFEEKKRKTLDNIVNVKQKVKGEIVTLKDRLKLARETIVKFKAELAKVQKAST
ncbi:YEATS domain-containing protein 4 isoform X2 [Scaptodrosophila lebanonensis]|nr:YEATS domain-containing protein 4 isoform X2 [Scaptodrosophila lebanonensis]